MATILAETLGFGDEIVRFCSGREDSTPLSAWMSSTVVFGLRASRFRRRIFSDSSKIWTFANIQKSKQDRDVVIRELT